MGMISAGLTLGMFSNAPSITSGKDPTTPSMIGSMSTSGALLFNVALMSGCKPATISGTRAPAFVPVNPPMTEGASLTADGSKEVALPFIAPFTAPGKPSMMPDAKEPAVVPLGSPLPMSEGISLSSGGKI